MFRADYIGVSVGRYILLLRLRRASHQLVFNRDIRVIDIALEAGFENPESFSRAFRNTFGCTPSAFRRSPDWEDWHTRYRFRLPERKLKVQVEIVDFESTLVAVLEHRGPVEGVNGSVAQFIEWRKVSGLSPRDSMRTFGVAYDNPDTTEPVLFRFDICGEVPANPHGVVTKRVAGGRCARVRHLGSHQRIGESIYPMYRDWLPQSGEELRDFPLFFHYVNLLPDTPEGEQALGRSRGGLSTKIHALVEGLGHLARFELTPGQAGDVKRAADLLEGLPVQTVMADTAYDAAHLIDPLNERGVTTVIPSHPTRKHPRPLDKDL